MAKPTVLTFPRILSSTNAPSAERLQFTSSIRPVKIVASPAQNKGNGRQRNGKMNLWRIGFILNLQNFSVSKKNALFPMMKLNNSSNPQTENKDMKWSRCGSQQLGHRLFIRMNSSKNFIKQNIMQSMEYFWGDEPQKKVFVRIGIVKDIIKIGFILLLA